MYNGIINIFLKVNLEMWMR